MVHFPPDFLPWQFSAALRAGPGDTGILGLSDIAVSLFGGILVGLAFVTAALVLRQRRAPVAGTSAMDQASALMPRTPDQRRWWLLVSLNAGVSEELCHRLFLPLLLVALVGNVLAAMLIAVLLFGLGHAYQGPRGMLLTMVVGLMMGLLYLATANLWIVMALHFLIDARAILFAPSAPRAAAS